MDGHLEVDGAALGARVHEPHLARVVLRQPPLPAIARRRFLADPSGRPPDAEGVVGAVDPVVEAPHEAALLVLQVAATTDAAVEEPLVVGNTVPVGVPVLVDVVAVGLHRQDAAVERQDEPGQHQVVDEDGVAVVGAVALRALVQADAAHRRALIRTVGVGHVAAHLGDVQATVAVECHRHRILDHRFGEDEFHAVPGRQDEAACLLCRTEGLHRRLGREVGSGLVGTAAARRLSGEREAREQPDGCRDNEHVTVARGPRRQAREWRLLHVARYGSAPWVHRPASECLGSP